MHTGGGYFSFPDWCVGWTFVCAMSSSLEVGAEESGNTTHGGGELAWFGMRMESGGMERTERKDKAQDIDED